MNGSIKRVVINRFSLNQALLCGGGVKYSILEYKSNSGKIIHLYIANGDTIFTVFDHFKNWKWESGDNTNSVLQ